MEAIQMSDFMQHFIYGMIIGSMYVLMAVGFSLIWGIMGLLNFSHGEFYMLGGYFTYYLFTLFNINPFVSVFLALAIVLAIGAGIFHVGIFPITRKPNWEINAVILTLGIGICLQNIALFTFGERYKGMPHFFKANIKFWEW